MACGQMCYMKASQLQEIIWIKQDSAQIRNAVVLLEKEKDNLRQAVRKLKVWFNIFSSFVSFFFEAKWICSSFHLRHSLRFSMSERK